jgi:hypothetical protein
LPDALGKILRLALKLLGIVSASPLWDKKVCGLQVTNLSEHTLELRCLISAANSGDQSDLRCYIREEMVRFIQQNYPEAFPRTRFASLPAKGTDPGTGNLPAVTA